MIRRLPDPGACGIRTAVFHSADMRHQDQIRSLVSFAADKFGPLGLLVNNATAPFSHGYEMNDWLDMVV